jgi:serine/threonine protein phosphatase PrpC
MTRFRWGLATDTGRTRSINQDNALAIEGLFAVADGMGGHRGGEVASEVAVRALRERAPLVTSVDLLEAIHLANDWILGQSLDEPALRGMGTTLCVLALVDVDGDERLAIANVGDSRVYLFASGELEQMTDDHSLVAALVREGRLTPQEAEEHPQRNILTRALGIDHEVSVDAWEVPPFVGDRWVLCSDGLFNEVSVDQMAAVLRRLADPSEAASELVRLANDSGGRDNITVLVVDIVDDEGHAAIAPSTGGAVTDNGPGPAFAAGIDGATDETSASNGSSARARRSALRPRFTWRVAAFLLALVVLAGAVVVAFAVYGSDDTGDSPPPLTVTFAPPTTTSTSTSSTTTLLTSTSTTAVSATTASTTTATSTPG